MPDIGEILKRIQRELSCPVCGSKFEMSGIKVRGQIDPVTIVQTTCPDGHLTLFMTAFSKITKNAIITDQILDLTNSLKDFNGDFAKIWKKSA